MASMRNKVAVVIAGGIALAATPDAAHAQYLDPGAGSILVQALLAVMVGVVAGVKVYWGKISGFLSRRTKSTGGR